MEPNSIDPNSINMQKAAAAIGEMYLDRRDEEFHMPRWGAYCVGLAVQMACRHPAFSLESVGEVRTVAEAIARQLIDHVCTDPDHLAAARAGWDQAFDLICNVRRESAEASPIPSIDPMHPRPSRFDLGNIESILAGEHDHFSAQLMRLVKRSDAENRARIRQIYPNHVDAVEMWERQRGGVQC